MNFVSRNVFVRCKDVFLRDGGVERTALNAVIDRPVTAAFLSNEEAVRERFATPTASIRADSDP